MMVGRLWLKAVDSVVVKAVNKAVVIGVVDYAVA
jgi:hypothetical protein